MADPAGISSSSSSSTTAVQNQKPPPAERETTVTDLNLDSLIQCASLLSLEDLSNMAMSCKYFQTVAYSDNIWLPRFSTYWKKEAISRWSPTSGGREAFLARRKAILQLRFHDPFAIDVATEETSFDHILLDHNDIIYSQGQSIQAIDISKLYRSELHRPVLNGHNARVTCMRLFPLSETSLFRSESQRKDNVLVTSSCDHTIRLWWKGSCQRCFRGHTGPVSTLSNQLLGDGAQKVLASGGEDGTVRLWSLSSSGKRGQRALKATLYGHVKAVKLMSVARHKPSLLVTISKDSRVRVWDTTVSSGPRSSCCVGTASIPGMPVNMKMHESLLYVGSSSSVVVIDLRTMQNVISASMQPSKLYSFEALPSKSLICTGTNRMAMLWDIRSIQGGLKPSPMAALDGYNGAVSMLHMDPYKIVAASRSDLDVNVWETDTGKRIRSLPCGFLKDPIPHISSGCSAMAVSGTRIATASYDHDWGLIRYSDFFHASYPVSDARDDTGFWCSGSESESDVDQEAAE